MGLCASQSKLNRLKIIFPLMFFIPFLCLSLPSLIQSQQPSNSQSAQVSSSNATESLSENDLANLHSEKKLIADKQITSFSKKARLKVLLFRISDMEINYGLLRMFEKALSKNKDIDILFLEVDSPGGMVDVAKKMVNLILSLQEKNILTITYVSPQGAQCLSAASFIALSTDKIFVSPQTSFGVSSPILIGMGSTISDISVFRKKMENALVSFVKSYALNKHPQINPSIVDEMIKEAKGFTAKDAVEFGIADAICENRDDIFSFLRKNGIIPERADISIEEFKPNNVDILTYYVSRLSVLYPLSWIAMVCLFFEITHPGFGLPGIIGIIALLLSLYGYGVIPSFMLWGYFLLGGIALLMAEMMIPGFGVFGITGTICILIATYFFYQTGSIPFYMLIFVSLLGAGIIIGIGLLWRKMKKTAPLAGRLSLVGKTGVCVQEITYKNGKVFADGTYWQARTSSKGKIIEKDKDVKIVDVQGLTLIVEEIEE